MREAIAELRAWECIGEIEAFDLTLVDCAYPWSWPGSRWHAIEALLAAGIETVGRHARRHYRGLADSRRDELPAGVRLAG